MSQPQAVVLRQPNATAAAGTANGGGGAMVHRGLVTSAGVTQQTLSTQPLIVNQSHPRLQRLPGQNHVRPMAGAPTAAAMGARHILINNPNAPGSQISVPLATLQSLQPGQGINAGENNLLVKTASGQYQILKVGQTSVASSTSAPGGVNSVSTSLPTHPMPMVRSATPMAAAGQGLAQRPVLAAPGGIPGGATGVVRTPGPPGVGGAGGPPGAGGGGGGMGQQMTPDTAKLKCKNFLATLLRLASEQPEPVANNVRALIQGLIDGKVQPEAFTVQLQKELNSSPQPCLVPFLKKSLPYLQHSLREGELTIEGVRAPSAPRPIPVPIPVTRLTRPSLQGQATRSPRPPSGLAQVVANQANRMSSPAAVLRNASPMPLPKHMLSGLTPRPQPTVVGLASPQQPPPTVAGIQAQPTAVPVPIIVRAGKTTSIEAAQRLAVAASLHPGGAAGGASPAPSSSSGGGAATPVKREKGASGGSYSAAGDEDINDVAAMGGVNLAEESQRMQGPADLMIGAHARSCKDETFLQTGLLHDRVGKLCRDRGLEDPNTEVIALLSHAVQARLKTLLEKLSVIAEHRMDVVRLEGEQYEVTQDVRGQLRFLAGLDKLERRRHEEAEKELLMRAAKSRTKSEDPEKERLRAKAREMQRLEEEQLRHEKANNTALLAIGGPKKRLRLDGGGDGLVGAAAAVGRGGGGLMSSSMSGISSMVSKPRTKRVHVRDLMFLMEQEKDLRRSALLWKALN